jgi:hypothetical protein
VPAEGIDLVVETAGHAAIEQHVLPALARGTPCVVASVGALSAAGFAEKLEAAAVAGRTQVQLIPAPSAPSTRWPPRASAASTACATPAASRRVPGRARPPSRAATSTR